MWEFFPQFLQLFCKFEITLKKHKTAKNDHKGMESLLPRILLARILGTPRAELTLPGGPARQLRGPDTLERTPVCGKDSE